MGKIIVGAAGDILITKRIPQENMGLSHADVEQIFMRLLGRYF